MSGDKHLDLPVQQVSCLELYSFGLRNCPTNEKKAGQSDCGSHRIPPLKHNAILKLPILIINMSCAHLVPNTCQEYRNISRCIELYRDPKAPKNGLGFPT